MKSILIAIDMPPSNNDMILQYAKSEIVRVLREAIKLSKGALLIGESAAIIPGADALPLLGAAISQAEQSGFAYKVMFIESSEVWERPKKE